ncbi:hypothetical protein KAU45_04990 [bacterium]|nr:hypothetical protein [bacterium]
MRTLAILSILALLVPTLAQEPEEGDEPADEEPYEEYPVVGIIGLDSDPGVSIQVTNTAVYRMYEYAYVNGRTEKIYGLQTFEDDLTATIGVGNLYLGGTLRFWQPRYDNVAGERVYEADLFKWYVGYRGEGTEGYYGTIYSTFGRGLTLHLYDDPIFCDVDNFIQGFYGRLDLGWVSATALAGQGTYEYDPLTNRTDDVRGFELAVNPFLPWIEIGGGIVAMDQHLTNDPFFGDPIKKRLFMPAVHISVLTDYADFYAEYARSDGYEFTGLDFEPYSGEAIYASAVGYLGRNSLLLEYKSYDHFYNQWNSPPEVSFSAKPLEAFYAGVDEEGYLARLTVSPLVGLSVTGGYCDAWDSRKVRRRPEYGGEVRWDAWPWHLVGGGWLHNESYEIGNQGDDSYYLYERTEVWPDLEVSYTFTTGHSLAVHLRYEMINTHEVQGTFEETELIEENPQGSVTYNWPEYFSATLSAQYALGDPRINETREYWLSGEITVHLGPDHDLTLYYGNQRGGLVCSGGVCRVELPFDGLKITLESRI